MPRYFSDEDEQDEQDEQAAQRGQDDDEGSEEHDLSSPYSPSSPYGSWRIARNTEPTQATDAAVRSNAQGATVSITKRFEFSAHHKLPRHQGKCSRDHGHNYVVEVTITGPIKSDGASDDGMVMDFGDLKALLTPLLDHQLDHYSLNTILENPTAEHLACWLLNRIPEASRVTVWETATSSATVERLPRTPILQAWTAATPEERAVFTDAIATELASRLRFHGVATSQGLTGSGRRIPAAYGSYPSSR